MQSVTPDHGSNLGQATVTLVGAQFTPNASVSLVGPDGTSHAASHIWWKDANTLWATFDLTGLTPAVYDVRVDEDGQATTDKGAFTVTTGALGAVQVNLVAPGAIRPGASGQVEVVYTNTGDTDVPAPLMLLSADIANLSLPDQAGPAGSNLQLLGINTNGPAGILSPGASGSILVDFQPTNSTGTINFSVQTIAAPDTSIDWTAFKNVSQPEFVPNDAWDAIFTNFTADAGTTLGQFQAALDGDATYLSQLGQSSYDVAALLSFAIGQANDSLQGATLTYALDATESEPGLPLVFSRTFLQTLSGRYSLGPLGRGWTEPWDISLSTDAAGNVDIQASGGHRIFLVQADGTYEGSAGDYATLTRDQGLYRLQESDGTAYVFGADGKLDYVEDTNGNRITAVYSGDQLTSLVHSNGDRLTFSYDAQGRITQMIDPSGRITTYGYDASDELLTSVTGPDGTTTYQYSTATSGPTAYELLSISYPDGTHQYFAYDDRGRLIQESRDGGAETVSYSFDTPGEVTITDATGASTKLLFNDLGQVGQAIDALGHGTLYQYDANSNLVQFTGPDGISYSYSYDSRGNLISQVDPLGDRVNFTYDPTFNRLLSVEDARGNTTNYQYDPQGDLLSITYPNGGGEQFQYDPLGQLTESINGRGDAIGYVYNNAGLLTRKTYADGTTSIIPMTITRT